MQTDIDMLTSLRMMTEATCMPHACIGSVYTGL